MVENITFVKIDFTIKALEDTSLPPYLCSTIRGIFGKALRERYCDNFSRDCENCTVNNSCIYTKLFHCFSEEDGKIITQTPPFTIYHKYPTNQSIQKGSLIDFCITVFGSACSYISEVVVSIKNGLNYGLGAKRSNFELVAATANRIYLYKDGMFVRNQVPHENIIYPLIESQKIEFVFDTPLKMKSLGEVVDYLDFNILWENIYRRVSQVSSLYCNSLLEANLDFSEIKLLKDNTRWVRNQRYSNRIQGKMSIGGIIGRALFEGDLTGLIPFIEAGRVLHIGKNCTMGLGHYDVFYY